MTLEKPIIKPCTLAQLAAVYGVSKAVMRRWLQPLAGNIGERRGWYYTATQVERIFLELGVPGIMTNDDVSLLPVVPAGQAG